MSLPPGFLEELRTRTTLSSVVGRKVTWDRRKSNLAKGDWWAPCPFHQEKSASFHVDDRKGFYYCFGCHAKGDAVTFLKETENLTFIEAVGTLAREAGMTMPERDPRAAQVADRRSQLIAVMDEAVKWFRLQLRTSAAADARAYLAKRGLSEAAQDRWDIGFAPDQRQGLFNALIQKGIPADLIVASGVCATPEDGGPPYDRFRDRIIFPIRDGRGRAISLGGRAMAPNARAKYLNGPETEIFDKGRNLFNHAPAREAAAKGALLIVAEGYMDVIALSEAGFKGAVAPLGTAVTEDQLHLMWRIHPSPILALDGDVAGQRAASRLIDIAIKAVRSGQELRFAALPDGLDPDDLIRLGRKDDLVRAFKDSSSMLDQLWKREAGGKALDSPERIAALQKSLREVLNQAQDKDIRNYYKQALKQKLQMLLFPIGGSFKQSKRKNSGGPTKETLSSDLLVGTAERAAERLREAVVLAVLIQDHRMIDHFRPDLELRNMSGDGHQDMLRTILNLSFDGESVGQRDALIQAIGEARVNQLLKRPHVAVIPAVRRQNDEELSRMTIAEQLAWIDVNRLYSMQIAEEEIDILGLSDEGLTWRLSQIAQRRNEVSRANFSDTTDLGEDRSGLLRQLHGVSDQIGQKKLR